MLFLDNAVCRCKFFWMVYWVQIHSSTVANNETDCWKSTQCMIVHQRSHKIWFLSNVSVIKIIVRHSDKYGFIPFLCLLTAFLFWYACCMHCFIRISLLRRALIFSSFMWCNHHGVVGSCVLPNLFNSFRIRIVTHSCSENEVPPCSCVYSLCFTHIDWC